ncbi:MAG: TetR/AcrR family transcriptional regulator [Gordonia paraffinivorans]
MSDPPPRRKRPGPAPIPREQVLVAAAEVFAESGYDGGSLVEIARRAHTSKPTIYKHFGDKAGLYRSCLESEIAVARAFLFDAYARAESDSIADEVTADVVAFFDYARERPHGFRLIVDDAHRGPGGEAAQTFTDSVIDRIVRRLAARTGLDTSSMALRQIAAMLVGASVYSAREALLVSRADPAAASRLAAEFMSGAVVHLAGRHPGD